MKRTHLAIALAFLMGVVVLTVPANRNEHAFAAPAAAAATNPLVVSGGTDALLLSCMDYRLIADVATYMQGEGMKGKYDYVILAGASLGVNNTKYPNWGKTFWEHLDTAIKLHSIHKVIILDHRNCGAYKLLLGKDFPADADEAQLKKERKVHKQQLDALAKAIHKKHPKLEVETLLMGLNGKVEEIE